MRANPPFHSNWRPTAPNSRNLGSSLLSSDCLFKKEKERKKITQNEWRYLEMKTDNDMQRYLQHTHKGNKIRKGKKRKERKKSIIVRSLVVGW
jgi:hypothetical protein